MKDKKPFKFRSFSERIATIKIDVIHRIGRPEDIPEDAESCFVEGLKKWRELNTTADFTKFCVQANRLVQTFRQVVHHQDALVSLLKESLSSAADIALQPLLDLTVQLARDLQTDFYPHFQDFLTLVSGFVTAMDSQIVEDSFTCLAYLIKFLWRYVVTDIQPIYKLYCSLLLSNKKAHVRRFAAESFAFLLRKCSKQENVVDIILQSLCSGDDHQNLCEGVGVLLFETMKGVNKQFHSSTKTFLSILLMRAVDASERLGCDENNVVVCLKKTMECMAEYCRCENSVVVWQVLIDCLTQVCGNGSAGTANQLCIMLELLHVWISWRKGTRIMCPAKICKVFADILPLAAQFSKVSDTLMASCSSLFMVLPDWSSGKALPHLLQSVYQSMLPAATIGTFSLSLFECGDFEKMVLPLVFSWLDKIIHQDESHVDTVLWILTAISQHRRKKLKLIDFSGFQHTHLVETVTSMIKREVTSECKEKELVSLWAAIQCAHLLSLTTNVTSVLTDRRQELLQCILDGGKVCDTLLFILCEMCTTLLQSGDHSLQWNDIIQLLHTCPDSVFTLQITCQFIDTTGIKCGNRLQDCSGVLLDNLTNPSQEVRLLSLKLLTSLEETPGLFSLCLKIQEVPTSLGKYREKLAVMHQLSYRAQDQYRQDDIYAEVALRYLIGSFYLNLHPMWRPISELISTHATEDNKTVFWRVFSKQLQDATQRAVASQKRDFPGHAVHSELDRLFYGRLETQSKGCDDGRHDNVNFRILLWKCMGDVAKVVEQRSRDVTPIFLDFIRGEYFALDVTSSPTQNVVIKDMSVCDEGDGRIQAQGGLSRKEVLKTMKVMLALFGKFHNPKAMFREPEMRQVFTMLLTHRDREIQQRALDALMCYHPPYLIPYRDNLNHLLSEETVRDELVSFSVDEETSIVAPEHRNELLPILIRILYGRMMSQLGGKGGKQGSASRRGMVLRFFAGCPAHEFAVLVDIAMQPFKDVMESTVAVRDIQVDPTAVVPLKKQQGFLNLLGQMFSQHGDQMKAHVPVIVRVLIYITHCCSHLLNTERQRIQPHIIPCLRSLRQTALQRLTKIFQNYEEFIVDPFKDDLFAAAVWPQLSRLKDECIQHPTALLSLLHVWTGRSHDFSLLGELCPQEMGGSILGHVFACLFSKNVSMSVVSPIVEMADHLLGNNSEDTSGVQLIEPHVGTLLGYLSVSVELAVGSSKAVPRLHLSLLYKLSEFVNNSEQSEMLVQLLLRLLTTQNRHGKGEETHILQTVKNLVSNVTSIETFLQPLSTLFYTLTHRESRQALCDVFQILSLHKSDLAPVARILQQLNSWDKSRVEDVDYDSRLLGFSAANELVDGEPIECDLLLPLVSSSCHTILHSDDMSLRNAASHFIQKVVEQVALAEQEKRDILMKGIVMQAILPAVRFGLNVKSEAVRHEYLSILSVLTRRLSNHARFKDLTILLNDNPEADFFENICHIQIHRRVRALSELATHITDGCFSPSTLSGFLLPPVAKELVTTTDHNLVNEAVNVIGAVAGQYKWSLYLPLLKRYLRLLTRKPDTQKTVSKVVVAILNAFHFDLTLVDAVVEDECVSVGDRKEGMEAKTEGKEEEGSRSGLSVRQARKIHDVLVKQVLPELNQCLIKTTDGSHKLGHAVKVNDQQDMLRMPSILAVVKLLQKLPKETLNARLPGLIMRICQTLKSRSRDVRDLARSTLVKVVSSLGPPYIPVVVSELRHLLNKGYQVHVMAHTVHSIVSNVSGSLTAGEFDACLKDVLEVSLNNLFGPPAEEREERELGLKLPEAKASHSYEMFEIAAKFTSASKISSLVEPLRQVLLTSQTVKTVHSIEEALRQVGLGLQVNTSVSATARLKFILDVLSHGMEQMQTKRVELDVKMAGKPARLAKPDLYSNQLVPEEPGRAGKRPEVMERTTAHVLVAFGLQLLLSGVKRQAFDSGSAEQMELLDAILLVVVSCTESQHNRVLSLSLRTLSHIVPMKISSFESYLDQLLPQIFSLLKQYSRTGSAVSGANQELSQTCFKTITVIIRNYTKRVVSKEDLEVLLTYVEEDLYDPMRQSTAFPLLKAILSRTLLVPMLHQVMQKVEELSVQSDSATVRLNCRQCVLQYMLDYPLKKQLQTHLDLFIRYLDYHTEDGRESVLEILVMMFSRFPQNILHQQASYFFVPLMLRLFNDESVVCKKLVSGAIRTLLEKIEVQKRDELFGLVLTWMDGSKVLHQRLASQACSLFVDVEGSSFNRRLSKLLPVMSQLLEDHRDFDDELDELSDSEVSNVDHLVFALLSSLGKMCKVCHLVQNAAHRDAMTRLWNCMERYLEHPHMWVQLAASRLFGVLFSCWKPEEILSEDINCEYLQQNLERQVSRLTTAFVKQLESPHVTPEQGEQVVKNLVFLAEVVSLMECEDGESVKQKVGKEVDRMSATLMISRVLRVGRIEAGYAPHQTAKRRCVLQWLGALTLKLPVHKLSKHLTDILKPVVKELTDKPKSQVGAEKESTLKTLAQEVSESIKKVVGREAFSRACSSVQQEIMATRESRKRERALEAVANPEKRAKRKVKKNLAKKESRKRKIRLLKHPAKWKKL